MSRKAFRRRQRPSNCTAMAEIARKLRRFLARAQSRSVWECVELAPAVERRRSSKAGASSTQSRTLRAVRLRLCRDVESLIPNLHSRPLMSITSCIESLQLQTDARRRPHGPHASARVTARVAPQKTPVNIASARVHGYRGVRGPLRSVQSSRFKVQGSRFKVLRKADLHLSPHAPSFACFCAILRQTFIQRIT